MNPQQSEPYRSKLISALDAARKIKAGNRIFIGTDVRLRKGSSNVTVMKDEGEVHVTMLF